MSAKATRTRDRSSLPRYRVELPILIDDMNLSVYAFRLYVHLKRVAERSEEGSCWESARTLATACNMSSGQVSKAKDELERNGLIVRHIKMLRGGIGDDIAIVDIWPENFKRYAPESDHRKESDHHTITSPVEVITTRSLPESDRHTITSDESDQEVIALTSKRSYSDPIDHDQYHIGVITTSPTPTVPGTKNSGDDGDFYRELRRRTISPSKSRQIADMGCDQQRILALIDNRPDRNDPNSLGRLINDIIDGVALDTVQPRAPATPRPPPAPQPGLSAEQLRELKTKHDYTRQA